MRGPAPSTPTWTSAGVRDSGSREEGGGGCLLWSLGGVSQTHPLTSLPVTRAVGFWRAPRASLAVAVRSLERAAGLPWEGEPDEDSGLLFGTGSLSLPLFFKNISFFS